MTTFDELVLIYFLFVPRDFVIYLSNALRSAPRNFEIVIVIQNWPRVADFIVDQCYGKWSAAVRARPQINNNKVASPSYGVKKKCGVIIIYRTILLDVLRCQPTLFWLQEVAVPSFVNFCVCVSN